MEKMWAPWRMEYIRSIKQEGCIFCDKPAAEDDRENLLLFRGKTCCVLMNLFPYNNGHLMIAPYEHNHEMENLPLETLTEVMQLSQECIKILRDEFRAEGFNLGLNEGTIAGAGIAEHIHFHIVPRWAGDTNFMPVTGHAKVLVQGLKESWDVLKPHFEKITL
ncbi:MAG: HIT domain-containing protein [Candidatus Marinimicrobia bacterium]|nr:HIT domain-containing protein [Candidatus Neomarinimicrobiota bacterium]